MPASNYEQIAADNIQGYGTKIDRFGPQLLSNRYSDRTHFIYELLQNAEDAIGWRLATGDEFPQDVAFMLQPDRLVIRHHGLPFSEAHVRAICSIGEGTKQEDLTSIGKHGIGFKSVYAYTQHPEIHSGDEHFVIDSFVRPRSVPARATSEGETLFHFPFDHAAVKADRAYEEIHQRLSRLDLKTLLFLRNVKSISWQSACGSRGEYLRESTVLSGDIEKVSLLGAKDSTIIPDEEHWLVFRKEVFHNSKSAGFAEVAFQLESVSESKTVEVVCVHESPLVVFFPTEKETHFGFLLQGPYRTTPSRDNVPRDDDWNEQLVLSTRDLVIDACRRMRDAGFLTVSAMDALIVDMTKYVAGVQAAMFRPIAQAIVDALRTEEFIPRESVGFLAGNNARIARAENLRGLVSPDQLTQLMAEPVDWVSGDIIRTSRLRAFLVGTIGIKEIDADGLVSRFNDTFLNAQSDAWIRKLYEFLVDQLAIRRQYWFNSKPIIRLTDNTHVAPKGADGEPTAYLPTKDRTEFPTVKPTVCDSDLSIKLLKDLGIEEPDPVDDVLHNVLPRYSDQTTVFPAEYDNDVHRIVEAFQTDSSRRQKELVQALTDACWIPCCNAANGHLLLARTESNTYLPTQKLTKLFQSNSSVWFVDRSRHSLNGKRCQAVLEACGAAEQLLRRQIKCTLSPEELRGIRRRAGLERAKNDWPTDYDIEGLEDTLSQIANAEVGWQERSFLLWDCIHDAIRHYRETFLFGEYRWSYSHEYRNERFPANFVRLLASASWLPGRDGTPRKPSQLCLQDLPDRFRENANSTFLKLLQFKPDEIRLLAEKTGIDTAVLDFIREQGLTVEELRKRLGVKGDKGLPGDHTAKPSPDAESEEDGGDQPSVDSNDSSTVKTNDGKLNSTNFDDGFTESGEKQVSEIGKGASSGAMHNTSGGGQGGLGRAGSRGNGSGGSAGGSGGSRSTSSGHDGSTFSGDNGHTANDREAIIKSLLRQLQEVTSTGVTPDGHYEEHLKSEPARQDDEKYRRAVIQYEAMHQRIAKPKDETEAGHDIDSFIREKGRLSLTLVRRIEVKGKSVPWEDAEIVELSDRQFKDAQQKVLLESDLNQHADFDYWLYVVEKLANGSFRVLPIRNPPTRSAHYEFRGGTWRHLAEDPGIVEDDHIE